MRQADGRHAHTGAAATKPATLSIARAARHTTSALLLLLLLSAASAFKESGQPQRFESTDNSFHPAGPVVAAWRSAAKAAAADPELGLHARWQLHNQQLCSIHVGQQPICSLIGPLLDYKFSTTPGQLRRAATFMGPNHRLRRVVRDLFTGKANVSIGVIGTSVSFGTGSSKRGVTDWFSMLEVALKKAFPAATVHMRNGCFPGTPSSFANMCLSKMVQPDVDLLFAEYVTNDFAIDSMFDNPKMRAYERLARKVLQMRKHPALVLVQVITWGQSFPMNDTKLTPYKKWYHESAEDQYGTVAQYYGLPWLSYRNAVWIEAEYASPMYPIGWKALTDDFTHPNDNGHKVVLDMIMWLIQQTAIDLLIHPFSRLDAGQIRHRLPPPMHPGNVEEPTEMCLMDEELMSIVREDLSNGFAFVNEGTRDKPKTGYVATKPGSQLVLEIKMGPILGQSVTFSGPSASPVQLRTLSLMVSYLKSYTGMGQAKITCKTGCTCSEKVVDAQHDQMTSTTFMQMMGVVAESAICQVKVAVLPATTSPSGGHKFKVTAVMMTPQEAVGFSWPDEPAVFVAADVFSGEFAKEEVEANRESLKGQGGGT